MLIILEGPDGSGKSTLARDLEELIIAALPNDTVEVIHSGPPTQHVLDEYERRIMFYRPGEGHHLILDRWHWGEYVYPEIFSRGPVIDTTNWWHIERYLQRLGAVVVACTQYTDEYRRIYAERGSHDAFVAGALPQIERRFTWARRMSVLPVVDYNWASPMHGNQHRIIEAATTWEGRASRLNNFITYLGPVYPLPEVLLLGDVRHKQTGRDETFALDPAFMPFSSTSGQYLIEAIHATEKRDDPFGDRIGIANTCDVDNAVHLWEVLGEPRIVLLGKNARHKFGSDVSPLYNVKRGYVQHPQFIRRFYYNHQWLYGQMIRTAATVGGDQSKWHESLRGKPARTSTPKSSKISVVAVSAATAATV